jgi:hypothetical protein
MRSHSVGVNLVANTKTTLFTVPTRNLALWKMLYVHNASTSSKTVSCWWYDKSENTEISVILDHPITAKNYFLLDGNAYVVLDEGDEIRAKSETGSAATILITVELDARSTVQNFA